jgi:V/A-type H+-transporting ATPase subunit B
MSEWDGRLLRYGQLFETKIMDLSVNIPLFEALDLCWEILADCFEPAEIGIRRAIIEKHWPKQLAK